MLRSRRSCIAILAVAVFAVASPALARTASVVRGKQLAIEACAACHQVTREQVAPPAVLDPDSQDRVVPPSFSAISAKYLGNEAGMRAFIVSPTHPMREQRFLPRDLDDIAAYILSLSATH
jgi:mono/diheme cytochrome c family protein